MNIDRITPLLVVSATLLYSGGQLAWYSTTPLGLYPVLDGREMLTLAKAIANSTLPEEAFYRAPLYPAILSLFIKAGISDTALIVVARTLNGLCHLTSTLLVMSLSRQLWSSTRAMAVSGVLFGLNPVALHFAGDPLDITLAITLMLAGFHQAFYARKHGIHIFACGALWGLGLMARPNFLPIVVIWPVWTAFNSEASMRWKHVAIAAFGPALVLGAAGTINYELAKDFQVLPWQGAYNLWAANKSDSNGRYYEQTLHIHSVEESINTARIESERLYRIENPNTQNDDYAVISRYWRDRAIDHVLSHPGEWLHLEVKKLFYLLNNFEQYNNKTYSFHKQRSPWLSINPICWSLVFMLGVVGAAVGYRETKVRFLLVCATTYAVGTLLFFVSARFRFPLVPLFAILSGGVAQISIQTLYRQRLRRIVLSALIIGLISLVPVNKIEADKTIVADLLLLSRATFKLGLHSESADYARRAVSLDNTYGPARELLCLTQFNEWFEQLADTGVGASLRRVLESCKEAAPISDQALRLSGVLYLHSKN
ncbi:MAG: hypothetical protein OEQ18_14420, partial [Gammaproteobacteria bacterium]|nr:hypothetical protein [Gammaproteobacteria bacterium]